MATPEIPFTFTKTNPEAANLAELQALLAAQAESGEMSPELLRQFEFGCLIYFAKGEAS